MMPQNLMLMLKVIIMALDLGITLDPKFNFWEKAEPYIGKISKRENFIDQYLYRAGHSFIETVDGMLDTPEYSIKPSGSSPTGTVKIDLVDTDILLLQQSLDRRLTHSW